MLIFRDVRAASWQKEPFESLLDSKIGISGLAGSGIRDYARSRGDPFPDPLSKSFPGGFAS